MKTLECPVNEQYALLVVQKHYKENVRSLLAQRKRRTQRKYWEKNLSVSTGDSFISSHNSDMYCKVVQYVQTCTVESVLH